MEQGRRPLSIDVFLVPGIMQDNCIHVSYNLMLATTLMISVLMNEAKKLTQILLADVAQER